MKSLFFIPHNNIPRLYSVIVSQDCIMDMYSVQPNGKRKEIWKCCHCKSDHKRNEDICRHKKDKEYGANVSGFGVCVGGNFGKHEVCDHHRCVKCKCTWR